MAAVILQIALIRHAAKYAFLSSFLFLCHGDFTAALDVTMIPSTHSLAHTYCCHCPRNTALMRQEIGPKLQATGTSIDCLSDMSRVSAMRVDMVN